jgi:hypothetical protein
MEPASAYDYESEVMTHNMLAYYPAKGIDDFPAKRPLQCAGT